MAQRSEERQFVSFTIGAEDFGVNISEVREIIRVSAITRLPNTAQYIRGVINLRGSIIVVVDLAMKLGLQGKLSDNSRIIVIEINGSTVGMVVDAAKEVIRMNSGQIQAPPSMITNKINASYIEGVGVIGERLLIILDLARILETSELRAIERAATQPSASSSQSSVPQPSVPQSPLSSPPSPSLAVAPPAPLPSSTPSSAPLPALPPETPLQAPPEAPPELHPVLQDVPSDWHFITHDGRPLKNVGDLLDYARKLDDATFQQFVNQEKNDFYNWILHCVKDQELADRIRHVRSKDDVTRELRDRIIAVMR
jgi:purine-binding chemotaxis protein CheW